MRESYHKLYRVLRPHNNNISRKIIFSPHQPINFQPPFCLRTQEVYKKNERPSSQFKFLGASALPIQKFLKEFFEQRKKG